MRYIARIEKHLTAARIGYNARTLHARCALRSEFGTASESCHLPVDRCHRKSPLRLVPRRALSFPGGSSTPNARDWFAAKELAAHPTPVNTRSRSGPATGKLPVTSLDAHPIEQCGADANGRPPAATSRKSDGGQSEAQ